MSSIFGGDPPPPTPTAVVNPTPPPTMPDPQSPDAMAARRRAEQQVMGRAGRQSTILSTAISRDSTGTAYNANKLGSST